MDIKIAARGDGSFNLFRGSTLVATAASRSEAERIRDTINAEE